MKNKHEYLYLIDSKLPNINQYIIDNIDKNKYRTFFRTFYCYEQKYKSKRMLKITLSKKYNKATIVIKNYLISDDKCKEVHFFQGSTIFTINCKTLIITDINFRFGTKTKIQIHKNQNWLALRPLGNARIANFYEEIIFRSDKKYTYENALDMYNYIILKEKL